jgi:hypothetical protein
MDYIFYLQFHAVALRAEARLNDIPLARSHPGEQLTLNIPVHQYLLPGRNTIEFRVYSGLEKLSSAATGVLRFAAFRDGDWLEFDEGVELAIIRPKISNSSGSFVASAFADVSIKGLYPWAWSRASNIEVASQRGALDSYVIDLNRMFYDRNVDGLLAQVATPINEDSLAYPKTLLKDRAVDFRKLFDLEVGEVWDPAPLDLNRIEYRKAADGRLVELLGADGLPILRTQAKSIVRPFDTPTYRELKVFVGLREGQFTILR